MIVIVDYGMGNLGSVRNMLKKIGAPCIVSSDPRTIEEADKLILPGVGAFDRGMRSIEELGLRPALEHAVGVRGVPVLGICLGMQLLMEKSEEGELPGLGWIAGDVVRFTIDSPQAQLKIPHMGWNAVRAIGHPPLFDDLTDDARFYFVHGYHARPRSNHDVLAVSHHGFEFVAAVGRDNVFGTQFHPEKSHRFGMRLLRNFAEAA